MMMSVPMDLNRFTAIVEAYGGSPSRWPEAERDAATAFMRASPEAQRLAQEAEALDSLLDMPETSPVTRDLQDRILSTLPAATSERATPLPRLFSWSKWIPAAAVACSLALGVVTGSQVPRLVGL